jgi:hypothetical protein
MQLLPLGFRAKSTFDNAHGSSRKKTLIKISTLLLQESKWLAAQ